LSAATRIRSEASVREPSPAEGNKSRSVCLVAPGNLASNPRIVKEADALHSAGFRVRVVAGDMMATFRELVRSILAKAPWRAEKVGFQSSVRRCLAAAVRRGCRFLVDHGICPSVTVAHWCESQIVGKLFRAAAAERADLYVGHYLPGLVAAARAAQLHQAAFGFDAEDSHVDELPDTTDWLGRRAARQLIEQRFLPRCRHLTAASPLIADALRTRYGVNAVSVLNVFPIKDAPEAPREPPSLRGQGPPTLYWFSQTIGPGRGLEPVIDALGVMKTPAHLHLRGNPASGYADNLRQRANRAGLTDQLHFHEPADPDRMAILAAAHDLGLALELTEPHNRAICLTNKAFTYLLAGVPALLSHTPAQDWLASELGNTAISANLADPRGLAATLDSYFFDPVRQREARRAAWRLGQERFNWDREQNVFLDSIRRTLEVSA
jgi:glycosyltransferase involved in cell wall biosynthesis